MYDEHVPPLVTPLVGPCFYGNYHQRRTIERYVNIGWTFLHWTEVPRMMAVLESAIGDVVFIDDNGFAWKGPTFSKTRPVPLEQYPLRYPDVKAEDFPVYDPGV